MANWINQLLFKKPRQATDSSGAIQRPRQRILGDQPTLSFDDNEIRLTIPDGREFTVAWHDLVRVSIQTTDEGPFQMDVFWLLETKEHLLRIPQGDSKFLNRLQKLPGFNNQAVISAMACADNKLFVCWQRKVNEIH